MAENVHTNGKGSKPRSCFSKSFKDNYDLIDWGNKNGKIVCGICYGSGWVTEYEESWRCPLCKKDLDEEVE